jgi:hypothetical protein
LTFDFVSDDRLGAVVIDPAIGPTFEANETISDYF